MDGMSGGIASNICGLCVCMEELRKWKKKVISRSCWKKQKVKVLETKLTKAQNLRTHSTSTSLVSSLLGIILQWILCILRRPTAGRGGRTWRTTTTTTAHIWRTMTMTTTWRGRWHGHWVIKVRRHMMSSPATHVRRRCRVVLHQRPHPTVVGDG